MINGIPTIDQSVVRLRLALQLVAFRAVKATRIQIYAFETFPIFTKDLRRVISVYVVLGTLPTKTIPFFHATQLVVFVLVAILTLA